MRLAARQPIAMSLFPDLEGFTPLLYLVVLLPAAVVWWTGRAITSNPDDPLLAERLLAARQRGRVALAFSGALLLTSTRHGVPLRLVLLAIARALAAFPLRRAVHGETWNPIAYLWFFFRLILAFFGFWLALMLAPELVAYAGRLDWLAAIGLAAVLLAWNDRYASIARWLMRATPVVDPELTARFARLVERSTVAAPRFDVVPVGGGVLANALALPSIHAPGMLMTSTFAERFDRDEIIAVSGHELAHLEHYSGRRLKSLYAQSAVLALAAALIEPVAKRLAPDSMAWIRMCWVFVVLFSQVFRAMSRQKQETESDLRAIELAGDPDALVRALIKLHAMARVPRRWDSALERSASHPSLARRIRSIRSASGKAAPPLEITEVFHSGTTTITMESDRLHWSDGGLEHAAAYARLTELRLDVARTRQPKLVAVDRSGQRWTFALDQADLPRAQRVLDVVDLHLADATGVAPRVAPGTLRLVSLTTTLLALSAMQFALLLPLALLLAWPSASLAAGAAAAALTTALVAWRDGAPAAGWEWWTITLAFCGTGLMALAWFGRKDEPAQPHSRALALLGVSTLLAWFGMLVSGTSAVRLYQSAQSSPAAIVLPVALGVALAWTRRGAVRRAGVPVVVAAALVFAVGSRTYLESFARDRFVGQGPPLAASPLASDPLSETTLPFAGASVQVSPAGKVVAIGADDDEDEPSVFQMGSPAGPFEPLEADSLFFVDDDRLLAITHTRDAVVLRDIETKPGLRVLAERRVEHVKTAGVALNRPGQTWSVLGLGKDGEVVRVEGPIGGGATAERRWPGAAAEWSPDGWVHAIAASHDHVLMGRTRYHASPFGYRSFVRYFAVFAPSWTENDYWIVGPEGRRVLGTSGLTVDCGVMRALDDRPICVAFDGRKTTMFSVDLAAAQLEAKATLTGRFFRVHADGSGWLSGFWGSDPIVMRADGTQAWRLERHGNDWVRAVGASGASLAALVEPRGRRLLRVYKLPTP